MKAIDNNPQGVGHYINLDFTFRALGRPEDANEVYLQAVNLAPEDAAYQSALGNIYFQSEAYETAIECFKRAVALDPPDSRLS